MQDRGGPFYRCFAVILSAAGQMTVYIWFLFAIVVYFYMFFWNMENQSKSIVEVNSNDNPSLFAYFNEEVNQFVKKYEFSGHKVGSISFSNATIQFDKGAYTVVSVTGVIDDFRGSGSDIDFSIEQESSFKSRDFKTGHKNVRDTILKINKEAGKEIAYLVHPMLKDGVDVGIKFSFDDVYHKLGKDDVYMKGKQGKRFRFRDYKKGHDSFAWCIISVSGNELCFEGKKIAKYLNDDSGTLNAQQKLLWFSPFFDDLNYKDGTPIFIIFTLVIGILVSVYSAHIKEKISHAYRCNRNCTKRSFIIVLIPVWTAFNMFAAYKIYLFMDFKDYSPIDNFGSFLMILSIPVAIVSSLYLAIKACLRWRYRNKPIDKVWKRMCIDEDKNLKDIKS